MGKIIPWEVIKFSQIFGAFPLKYTEDSKAELRLSFSPKLYYWGIISFSLITSIPMLALMYAIYVKEPSSNRSLLAFFFKSVSLTLQATAVASFQTRKYQTFFEICQILERIDKRLELRTEESVSKRKVYFTLLYLTMVLAFTYTVRSSLSPDFWLYFVHRFVYFSQASLLLQFTFVCNSIAQRFTIINDKIETEAMKSNQLKRTTSGTLDLGQLGALINSYSQLCEAVEKANIFYGVQLLTALFSGFAHETSSIYILLRMDPTKDVVNVGMQAIWVFSHTAYMFLLVLPATAVLDAAEETAPIISCLLSWCPTNIELRKKLKMFLLQLSHYKRGFSVIGLFQVDNEVLTSLASTVTTYLVILLQAQQVSEPGTTTTDMTVSTEFTLATQSMS